jgi:CRP-like cAMP-binding protein
MQIGRIEAHSNFVLSRLTEPDYRLLSRHLEKVDLPVRMSLEHRQRRIDWIYFPEAGFASVVADAGNLKPIEVGLIGREGMSGLAIILGNDRADHDTYMQAAGHGWRMKAPALMQIVYDNQTVHRAMLRFAHSFLNQTARTVLANGRGKIDERLARWILMADDRLGPGELPLTQEFLAMMLAVTRPGVTIAIKALEEKGLIERRRGLISVLNRQGLLKLANGTYAPADYD